MSDKKVVLIYRRTHTGDPCDRGVFGCHGCMGKVREWKYDAVIGIGGKTAIDGISRKLTWIGISP